MSAHEEYRLTGADEAKVLARIAETLDNWRAASSGRVDLSDPNAIETLYRTACNSIGCSDADLRDSERAWIRAEVDAALA